MNDRRILKKKYKVNDCKLRITNKGEQEIIDTEEAYITAEEVYRNIRMPDGRSYKACKDRYSLILCEGVRSVIDFDNLEDISRFDILLRIKDKCGEIDTEIDDASPVEIRLDGDWLFSIPEDKGKKLIQEYKAAKEI